MLKRREILVGKCYVNEGRRAARQVVEAVDRFRVKYNEHDLATGRLLRAPHRVCRKRELVHWANREATSEEATRLDRDEIEQVFEVDEAASRQPAELTVNGHDVQEQIRRHIIQA